MAELATLARPYADAVFELARDAGTLDQWSEDLTFLTAVTKAPEMAELIKNPKVEKATLSQITLDISGSHISEAAKNLVKLLIDNGKLAVTQQLAAQYEVLKAEHQARVNVEITSAYPVEDTQREQIEVSLQKRFGKSVSITVTEDKELIGGWLIRTGDQVIDLSVKGRLQTIAAELHS